jgi:hypothetical protein
LISVRTMPDFFDLNYLAKGSAIQQKGFRAITSLGIMSSLKEFSPVVVGTLPLDLFTDKSDIDIVCCFPNAEDFAEKVFFERDAARLNFYISRKMLDGVDTLIANFEYEDILFEVVGQAKPVREQIAFRHMVAEWKILSQNDAVFREKILELKKEGIKTEPAFAQLLGLKNDPYQELLRYS